MLHRIRRALSLPFGLPLDTPKSAFLYAFAAAMYRFLRVHLRLYDDLTRLASEYRTDKGVTIYPFHGYTRHYHELFKSFRPGRITLLEIGLARKRDRGNAHVTTRSLQMWIHYFPRAQIVGFDLDDFSAIRLPRATIFRGDQGNPQDLLRVAAAHPRLDIIIDDGSHASFHQQTSLRTLWPHLAHNGIYVIEDLDEQPATLERSLPPCRKTRDLVKDLPVLRRMIEDVADVRLFDSPIRSARETMACIVKK